MTAIQPTIVRRRYIGQNAILDRGLGTILATVAILATLGTYYAFSGDSKLEEQIAQINGIASEVRTLYVGQTSYDGVDRMAYSPELPDKWKTTVVSFGQSLKSLQTIYHGALWTASGSDFGHPSLFLIQLNVGDIPQPACVRLATTRYAGMWKILLVNSSGFAGIDAPGSDLPSVEDAVTTCSTKDPFSEHQIAIFFK